MPGKNRAPARWARMRDALQERSAAFNSIHDDLVWSIAHTPSGPERDKLEKLLEPFQSLLDRYPATTAAAKAEPAPTPAAKDAPGTRIP